MSTVIECDSCGHREYQDARSEKGAYFMIWVNRQTECHLCRKCFKERLGDVFPFYVEEEQ